MSLSNDEIDANIHKCDHGIKFDLERTKRDCLSAHQVQRLYPRLFGPCPKNCGYVGIAYASWDHYHWGDW